MKYFVTAIGTDSGKTVASAILVEALKADYWKPIQAGRPTDTETIRQLVSSKRIIHPEHIILKTPASPHAAAAIEGTHIKLKDIQPPQTSNTLIIEGAGGLMVPINDYELMVDLVPHMDAEVILVCNIYLGSINHSLMSLQLLQSRGYSVKGLIFNGPRTPSTQSIIMKYADAPCLLHIEEENSIDKKVVQKYAKQLKSQWNELD